MVLMTILSLLLTLHAVVNAAEGTTTTTAAQGCCYPTNPDHRMADRCYDEETESGCNGRSRWECAWTTDCEQDDWEWDWTSSTTEDITCNSHDDCPADYPFCYAGYCDLCSECEYCEDGIDGTCGSCGDGYPTRESGDCTGTTGTPGTTSASQGCCYNPDPDDRNGDRCYDEETESGCNGRTSRWGCAWTTGTTDCAPGCCYHPDPDDRNADSCSAIETESDCKRFDRRYGCLWTTDCEQVAAAPSPPPGCCYAEDPDNFQAWRCDDALEDVCKQFSSRAGCRWTTDCGTDTTHDPLFECHGCSVDCNLEEGCTDDTVKCLIAAEAELDAAASVSDRGIADGDTTSIDSCDSSAPLFSFAVGVCIGVIITVLAVMVMRKQKERKQQTKAVEVIHVPDESKADKTVTEMVTEM